MQGRPGGRRPRRQRAGEHPAPRPAQRLLERAHAHSVRAGHLEAGLRPHGGLAAQWRRRRHRAAGRCRCDSCRPQQQQQHVRGHVGPGRRGRCRRGAGGGAAFFRVLWFRIKAGQGRDWAEAAKGLMPCVSVCVWGGAIASVGTEGSAGDTGLPPPMRLPGGRVARPYGPAWHLCCAAAASHRHAPVHAHLCRLMLCGWVECV